MYQWRKKIVSWTSGRTLYLSIPFTWLLPEAEEMARSHHGPVIAGGPAVKLIPITWAKTPDLVPYDVLAFHNPCATFTSRGCPNHCPFCAVPIIEPIFQEYLVWKPAPLVCDNNLLACSKRHFRAVIKSLLQFPFVDFNQGLEATCLTEWHVNEFKMLRHVRMRFGFDEIQEAKDVEKAIDLCRHYGLNDISVYCLIGFEDTPALARQRLEMARSWGVAPVRHALSTIELPRQKQLCGRWLDRGGIEKGYEIL
jgi:hypothetical protein